MSDTFFRFEFKYPVHETQVGLLERDLLKVGAKRAWAEDQYTVTSLYFDTPEFSDYSDKAGGFLRRKKLRARIYKDALGGKEMPEVWLEIKEKQDMMIYKRRIVLSRKEWDDFSKTFRVEAATYSRLDNADRQILRGFIYDIACANRRPCLFVQYRRKPFIYKLAGLDTRITLDYGLEAASSSTFNPARMLVKVAPGQAVMEVKYKKIIPRFFECFIKKYNLQRSAYSKYALSFEAVRRFYPEAR